MAMIISEKRISQGKLQDQLDSIKSNIRDTYQYFRENYDRFNYFRKFVFQTSISQNDIQVLRELGKPILEFNILEAYISRQCGEFAAQEPSFMVSESDDSKSIDPRLPQFIEDFLRATLRRSNSDNMEYEVFRDLLSGGFSVMEVYTDYLNSRSFDQNIYVKRCKDPTLVGFDKMASESHKGDGEFCFQLFPMSRDEFECKYGKEYTQDMKFTRNFEGFSWSYSTDNQDVVMVADYYKKKRKKEKIVQLITGDVMPVKEYERMVEEWNDRTDLLIQAPAVIGKSRETETVNICRHRIIENHTLEYVDTDYSYFPLVFVDGNSVMIKDYSQGSVQQFTKPYVYQAEGTQKLKNFSGITLANEIENLVQHKFMVQKEAIPAEYKDAYINPQKASVLVYNGFKMDDANVALQAPMPVPRVPCPPEVISTFQMTDQITQSILGSYDAALGINNNQLSGKAISEGAMQSNAASKPYIVGYLRALNHVGSIIIDLIPKYILTDRHVHVKDIQGDMSKQRVNNPGGIQTNFSPDSLHLHVEAGVNFEVQKSRSLQVLISLMQASPTFAAYMATEPGLQSLLDNLDIRGIDALKQGVSQFSKQQAIQQKQQQQMAMQMNPANIKMQELQQKAMQNKIENSIEAARLVIEDKDADTKRLLALSEIGEKADKHEIENDRIAAEQNRTAVTAAIEMADIEHSHKMDLLNLHHQNQRHQQSFMEKQNGKQNEGNEKI